MDTTGILNLLEMKVEFPIQISLHGMIGVIFYNSNKSFPLNKEKLGKVLGPVRG